MTLLAELDARLQALHSRTAETPLFNPVFQVSLELSRQIESDELPLSEVANLVAELECEGLLARAKRLERLVAPLDLGLDRFKFFPAEANGGIPALKAISAPFAMAWFCPTGGITQATAPAWLALDAVLCCGGSWLVGAGKSGGSPDVAAIEAAARAAVALAR